MDKRNTHTNQKKPLLDVIVAVIVAAMFVVAVVSVVVIVIVSVVLVVIVVLVVVVVIAAVVVVVAVLCGRWDVSGGAGEGVSSAKAKRKMTEDRLVKC